MELLQSLVPAVLLIGALLVVRRGASRGLGRGGSDRMRVAHRVGVSRGASVAVVEIDGRRFLVGSTEHGVSLLTELAEQPPPEPEGTTPERPGGADLRSLGSVQQFPELLRGVIARMRPEAPLK